MYVADRENHRVQIFDSNGKYQTQWNNLHRPCTIYISEEQLVYVGDLGWGMAVNRNHPSIGPWITVLTTKGERLARIGHMGYGRDVGQFIAPHSICLDSKDNIYLGEVAWTNVSQNESKEAAEGVRSFQKLVKVS